MTGHDVNDALEKPCKIINRLYHRAQLEKGEKERENKISDKLRASG